MPLWPLAGLWIVPFLHLRLERSRLCCREPGQALLQLEPLCAQALDVEADIVPMRQAFSAARTYQLSAHDSVYLDLALRVRLPLATLDVPLRKAAGKAGVELLS